MFDILKHTPAMPNGEVCLTDAIQTIADTTGAYAYTFDGKRYDVGDKLGYIQATVEYGLRDENLKEGLKRYLKSLKL